MPFTIAMPKLSPTMEEGIIAKWHKKEGDLVHAGDLLVEVTTDKATIEYQALDGGYLRKILVAEGGKAAINEPIAVLSETMVENIDPFLATLLQQKEVQSAVSSTSLVQASTVPARMAIPQKGGGQKGGGRVIASPLAKRLAQERGIDLHAVQGSGPRGRITSRDLTGAAPCDQEAVRPITVLPVVTGNYRVVPLTPMRKVIAERLTQAKNTIPHIYVRQEIDALALFTMREQLIAGGEKITFNDFVIKACAQGLRDHPSINSGFSAENQSILLFQSIDISVAVTIPGGLITPIVRDADAKSLAQISDEVKQLALRAKAGKLKPEEYQGGTFTISNLGMFGITDFCAIINPPQSAILAVGGIDDTVRVQNGQFVVGKKMHLVLSADHRVVDGVDAAQFLKGVQKYLENPALLLG